MYIQLTTKCNMQCIHCGYDCGPNGQNMSMATFRNALAYAEDHGEPICLGGGEPTTHPQFYKILAMAIAAADDCSRPMIITNGKITEKALVLAKLDAAGVIFAELSRDEFHEEISPRVVEAFETYRDTSHNIIAAGRATDWGWSDDCICEELFVTPDGRMWACGCQTEQFGTVDNPQVPDDYYDRDYQCSTKQYHWLEDAALEAEVEA